MLSINDSTTKLCTSFLVVRAVLRLPLSVLLVCCEPQLGRRLETGTALRSELLCELLLVREQDTSDRDQVKWFDESPETVILRVVWFAQNSTLGCKDIK